MSVCRFLPFHTPIADLGGQTESPSPRPDVSPSASEAAKAWQTAQNVYLAKEISETVLKAGWQMVQIYISYADATSKTYNALLHLKAARDILELVAKEEATNLQFEAVLKKSRMQLKEYGSCRLLAGSLTCAPSSVSKQRCSS